MGKFDGIPRQVDQDLLQTHAIAKQLTGHIRFHADHQIEIFFCRIDRHDASQAIQDVIQIELGRGDLHATRLNLGKIEDIVEDQQQGTTGPADHLDILLLRRIQRSALEQVGHAEHRIERGADFMAHVGQKFTLRLAGQLRLILGPIELRLGDLQRRNILGDPQKAGDAACAVADRRRRQQNRQLGAIFAHITPLLGLVAMTNGMLNQDGESGHRMTLVARDLDAARDDLLHVMKHHGRAQADHFGGLVPQHPFGAGVKQRDHPLRGGGNDGDLNGRIDDALQFRPRRDESRFRLFMGRDVTDHAGKEPLALTVDFGDRDLHRDQTATLVLGHHLAARFADDVGLTGL